MPAAIFEATNEALMALSYLDDMVMLQVKQFSSADGKGGSSHPKSGTSSLVPDHSHSFSLSISFPAVQYSNRERRRVLLMRYSKTASLSSTDSIVKRWAPFNSQLFFASIQPILSLLKE